MESDVAISGVKLVIGIEGGVNIMFPEEMERVCPWAGLINEIILNGYVSIYDLNVNPF